MKSLSLKLRNTYEKNFPELYAAVTGPSSRFIYSNDPRLPEDVIPVFCYHELRNSGFEKDLEFLSVNGYRTVDAQTVVDHITGKCSAPPRSVALTMDDGSHSLYSVGLPLLRAYSMKAIAFIAPRFHRANADVIASETNRLCTWEELIEMEASGAFDVQSHSYEHRYVPRWPEPVPITGEDPAIIDELRGPEQAIEKDFYAAKVAIEDRLSKTVKHLAFVKYVGSDDAILIGQKCGYESFWWGYLPRHQGNRPGQPASRITRIDGWYLRRLPGSGRRSLGDVFREKYGEKSGSAY